MTLTLKMNNRSCFTFFKVAKQVNFLSYKAEPNHIFKETNKHSPNLKKYQYYVLNKTLHIKQILQKNGLKLPLYLTEWNTLTGKTRNMNGTFFRGAIIVKDILTLNELITGYGFWLNIDLYESNTHQRKSKNDGLELFHFNNSKRPAYFSLVLENRMKG